MTPLNDLAAEVHANAVTKGFLAVSESIPEKLVLIHAELSEALESHRAGDDLLWHSTAHTCDASRLEWAPCDCPPKPEGIAVELADVLIRTLDLMAHLDIDIDAVVAEKHRFNRTRPYLHGKAY